MNGDQSRKLSMAFPMPLLIAADFVRAADAKFPCLLLQGRDEDDSLPGTEEGEISGDYSEVVFTILSGTRFFACVLFDGFLCVLSVAF